MAIGLDRDSCEIRVPLEDAGDLEDRSRDLGIGSYGVIVQVDHGPLVAAWDELAEANVSSLAKALSERGAEPALYVNRRAAPVRENFMDIEDRFRIDVVDGHLVAIVTDRHGGRPPQSEVEIKNDLARIVSNYGCSVRGVRFLVDDGTPPADLFMEHSEETPTELVEWHNTRTEADLQTEPHDVELSLATGGDQRVDVLLKAASALADYMAVVRGGAATAATIMDLCRAGHHRLILGMAESEFLEVKSAPHPIDVAGDTGKKAKVELAQDVARFANGSVDAVLLVGFRESKSSGASVIEKVAPVNLLLIDPVQIRQVLDARIVPPLDGLVVEQFPAGEGKGLLAILVPKQAPELQPFLVHGTMLGDKFEGDFFSIVRRRGEGSITTTAQEVHAYIVAGKRHLHER